MDIIYGKLRIRNAEIHDASLLHSWWNDGRVMAHAGFPNGTGETLEYITELIKKDSENAPRGRRLILEYDSKPIGEANYTDIGGGKAEIGIKICEFSAQDKGYGRVLLSMLIGELFKMGFAGIVLDTNLNNKRAQHVYELLGFKKLRVNADAWRNQLGELQSSVDYELEPDSFNNFAKA